jgi:hypothetical protein
MARIGLTLYLMLATVAGPWLCCCTAGQLPVSFSPTTPEPSVPHTCCGCGAAPSGEPAANDEQAPDNPSPPAAPDGPCPCRKGLQKLSPLAKPVRSPGVEPGGSFESLYPFEAGTFFTVSSLDPRDQGRVPGEPITFPFYGPRDILRALHILRC